MLRYFFLILVFFSEKPRGLLLFSHERIHVDLDLTCLLSQEKPKPARLGVD